MPYHTIYYHIATGGTFRSNSIIDTYLQGTKYRLDVHT